MYTMTTAQSDLGSVSPAAVQTLGQGLLPLELEGLTPFSRSWRSRCYRTGTDNMGVGTGQTQVLVQAPSLTSCV